MVVTAHVYKWSAFQIIYNLNNYLILNCSLYHSFKRRMSHTFQLTSIVSLILYFIFKIFLRAFVWFFTKTCGTCNRPVLSHSPTERWRLLNVATVSQKSIMFTKDYANLKVLLTPIIYRNGLSFCLSEDPIFQGLLIYASNYSGLFYLPVRYTLIGPPLDSIN